MNDALWMALPFVVSLGSGILAYIVTQARYQTAMARERETMAGASFKLICEQKALEEKVRTAEAEARRRALDEFLGDVRVEERRYLREIDSPSERRRCLVLQERVCFRNIPLSQWIERDLDVQAEISAPEPVVAVLTSPAAPRLRRLLR